MTDEEVEDFLQQYPQIVEFHQNLIRANNFREHLIDDITGFLQENPIYNRNSIGLINLDNLLNSLRLNNIDLININEGAVQNIIETIRQNLDTLIQAYVNNHPQEYNNSNNWNVRYTIDDRINNLRGIILESIVNIIRLIRGEYNSGSDSDSSDYDYVVSDDDSDDDSDGDPDNELLQEISRIERILRDNPNLDEEFKNAYNEDIENLKAELERRHPITGEVAEARRAETTRRMEEMRANTARLAAAAAATAVKEEETVFGECALCLEPINYGDEAVDAHNINGKKSGHIYHKDCIMNICNNSSITECPECRAPLLCEEIKQGKRDVNTNLGLKGGKRKRSRSSKKQNSKRSKKLITKKRKGKKKYTNKRKGGKKRRVTKRKY